MSSTDECYTGIPSWALNWLSFKYNHEVDIRYSPSYMRERHIDSHSEASLYSVRKYRHLIKCKRRVSDITCMECVQSKHQENTHIQGS